MEVSLQLFLIVVLVTVPRNTGFPQGAPAEACESLLPRHYGTEPQSPRNSPYRFVASSRYYDYRTDGVYVELSGARFKGFLIAAIDPRTHERIGDWFSVEGTTTLPCAAISHADSVPKKKVILLWHPPKDRKRGHVVFVATVLESYSNYFSGLVAKVKPEEDESF